MIQKGEPKQFRSSWKTPRNSHQKRLRGWTSSSCSIVRAEGRRAGVRDRAARQGVRRDRAVGLQGGQGRHQAVPGRQEGAQDK